MGLARLRHNRHRNQRAFRKLETRAPEEGTLVRVGPSRAHYQEIGRFGRHGHPEQRGARITVDNGPLDPLGISACRGGYLQCCISVHGNMISEESSLL
jgi:hypothetical protein